VLRTVADLKQGFGGLLEIPPTGKEIEFGGVNIFRFEDGKIVEDWVYRETAGMMRQPGACPAPAPV
jgi:predicted ester cyclase